ncbi:hypothetical protein KC669_05115, partial [Candidatus Dojkabacteria bacterium]|nr:hypothetical protein [Candidatus Dojkabacteria bacterium]
CALSYVLDIPEFNGIYSSKMCVQANCPAIHRENCSFSNEKNTPAPELIKDAIAKMGIYRDAFIDTENRKIIIDGSISHAQAIYLTQRLNYPIMGNTGIDSENEWGGPVIGRQDLHLPFNTEIDYEL